MTYVSKMCCATNQSKKATDFFKHFSKREPVLLVTVMFYTIKTLTEVQCKLLSMFFLCSLNIFWAIIFPNVNITDDSYDANSISRDRKDYASFISCDGMVPVHVASLSCMFWRVFLLPLHW